MKNKIYFWMMGLLMTLVSCNVTADVTLHEDKTQSIKIDFDGKEVANIFKDEDMNKSKSLKEKDELPKEWTSLYDMNLKKDKKERITDSDTLAVMKKIYVKGGYDKNDLMDIFFKTDKLTNEELSFIFKTNDMPVLDLFSRNEWDGKTLKINTSVLNDITIKKKQCKESDFDWRMFTKNYRATFHFNSEIKKIEGKHDLVRKINKNTVEIKFNVDDIMKRKNAKFKNNDSFITITTK